MRHLATRHHLAIATLNEQANATFAREIAAHGNPPHMSAQRPAIEAQPLIVITTGRGISVGRGSVDAICADSTSDPEILAGLWGLLVETLEDGQAAEDPEEMNARIFYVEDGQRPALARQLIALRDWLLAEGEIDAEELSEPERGLESFLT